MMTRRRKKKDAEDDDEDGDDDDRDDAAAAASAICAQCQLARAAPSKELCSVQQHFGVFCLDFG
eukprot:3941280-Rhodomonas_salina.2